MRPYYEAGSVTLWHGDCLDVLRSLPDASVDAVVTDPPYDLTANKKGGTGTASINLDSPYGRSRIGTGNGSGGFMGKAWDSTGIAFTVELWTECLRVLKPGGHLLAFGGSRTWHRMAVAIDDAGFEVRDSIAWLYGSGFPKSLNLVDEAGERTGWGTALKPAFEPIVVARKPLVGTVAANVLQHGTGALNIDGCRVGEGGGTRGADRGPRSDVYGDGLNGAFGQVVPGLGRWPANVVLDESQAAALDEQSGELTSGANPTRRGSDKFRDAYGEFAGQKECTPARGADMGGASRFFYVAKADSSERVRVNGIAHPTVKPLELVRWLVRLVTPPGGTVLEPFAGSGTTVEACLLEGFRCIAVERETDYLPLITQRINRRRDPVAYLEAAGEIDGTLFGGAA